MELVELEKKLIELEEGNKALLSDLELKNKKLDELEKTNKDLLIFNASLFNKTVKTTEDPSVQKKTDFDSMLAEFTKNLKK
jgi:hypothetical protein